MNGLEVLLDRLRVLRSETWDPDAGLERVPPGVAPGVDIGALGLHIVRETAYGALLDLEDGEVERASIALRRLLALQLDAPGRPWHGTFPVTAEQPPPPDDGAIEWLHYDPNWRQFIGTALALVVERHAPVLADDLVTVLEGAVRRCVAGEPEDRIAPWYTNPDLMHAWLLGWVGAHDGSSALVEAGEERARRAVERVRRNGDVDEYSSPTYDGVDLIAAGLWAAFPPSPAYGVLVGELLDAIGPRVAALFHPGLGAMCGPYIRAYGLGLDRYVALIGPWLVAAGAPVETVLPWPLDTATDHVHDLWSVPLVAMVAPAVVPSLAPRTDLPRRHEQHFAALGVTAVSVLTPSAALGAETGRHPEFAATQHVPVTVHHATGWVGAAIGDGAVGIDAVVDIGGSEVHAVVVPAEGGSSVSVRTLWSERPADLAVGAIALECSVPPTTIEVRADHPGWWATLTWSPVPDRVTLRFVVT